MLDDGKLLKTWVMPHVGVWRGRSNKNEVNGAELAALLIDAKASHMFVEQVGGLPGQSAPAAFNFGRAAGAPEYAAAALGMVVTMVPPGTWKRKLSVIGSKYEAVAKASRLFPGHVRDWSASIRGNGTKDEREGRAEAALIGYYGWLSLGGSPISEETEDAFA